ncbi:MAG: 3-phosphoshikimate 1-carboxyvinyltransferase, partial [Acidobacteriia bacterium]|nr:3-phosphoshikimate 1-carboxyvinyltransferase [Terriglobia bacterium]
MQQRLQPASSLEGSIALPGDKSISHRYAMIASLAEGVTRIANYSTGADCHSTLGCMRALGVEIEAQGDQVTIHGQGLDGLRAPKADLDAGNSGSTIRMLSGILAAQPFRSRIGGDESLSRRPMQRIITPLAEMGARICARQDRFPPLEITGSPLRPIAYTSPIASAQVKTCVLFAGLFAEGQTSV